MKYVQVLGVVELPQSSPQSSSAIISVQAVVSQSSDHSLAHSLPDMNQRVSTPQSTSSNRARGSSTFQALFLQAAVGLSPHR